MGAAVKAFANKIERLRKFSPDPSLSMSSTTNRESSNTPLAISNNLNHTQSQEISVDSQTKKKEKKSKVKQMLGLFSLKSKSKKTTNTDINSNSESIRPDSESKITKPEEGNYYRFGHAKSSPDHAPEHNTCNQSIDSISKDMLESDEITDSSSLTSFELPSKFPFPKIDTKLRADSLDGYQLYNNPNSNRDTLISQDKLDPLNNNNDTDDESYHNMEIENDEEKEVLADGSQELRMENKNIELFSGLLLNELSSQVSNYLHRFYYSSHFQYIFY